MARCASWKPAVLHMCTIFSKEQTQLIELLIEPFILLTSFLYPLGSLISKPCFKPRKANDKSSEERDRERKLYWLWVSRSFLQNSGSNKGRERACLGRVMAVHSKGRVTALWWPLRRSTSMDDESSGSVTHGAVGQEPALARLGIVQEREVHFIARLPQLGCGLQNREQGTGEGICLVFRLVTSWRHTASSAWYMRQN